MSSRARSWMNRLGFLLGVLVALGFVAAGQVPGGDRPLDARLTVTATATGGLAVSPEGRVLVARGLAPGAPAARARVRLVNQTSAAASVLVRATASNRELAGAVQIRLRAGRGPALQLPLEALRRWRRLGRSLAPQAGERIAVRAWIPAAMRAGYQARRADVTLEFVRSGAEA